MHAVQYLYPKCPADGFCLCFCVCLVCFSVASMAPLLGLLNKPQKAPRALQGPVVSCVCAESKCTVCAVFHCSDSLLGVWWEVCAKSVAPVCAV